ncbi:MAG: hypothetical protein ACR2M8_12415 [Pyrinomonadaceae bacterium]|nr:hypothetical protein [Blastocatellia bacterium]
MNIRETLASGQSKRNTLAIVAYIGDDPKRFADLMSIFFEGEYRPTRDEYGGVRYDYLSGYTANCLCLAGVETGRFL